jgi:Holliday junction resolvase
MTAYERGNHFERRVADQLRTDGYQVWQTRGSKSPADILAAKTGQLLLVQVKSGEHGMSGTDWNLLLELANRAGATPILATRTGPALRRIHYRRLTGPHRHGTRSWPCEDWTPDEVGG